MTYIKTDSLLNHDLTSPHIVGTYTSDASRHILAQCFLDKIAGNGDYTFYCKLQKAGIGLEFIILPKTTVNSGLGETRIAVQSEIIEVNTNDVLTIWADCLPADVSVDSYVVFDELAEISISQIQAISDSLYTKICFECFKRKPC